MTKGGRATRATYVASITSETGNVHQTQISFLITREKGRYVMHFETATSTMGGNLSLDDHERINNLVKRAISYLSAVDREALVTQGQTSMFRAPVAIDGVESTRDVITTVATITTPADSVDVERLSQALRFLSEKLKFETCINALLESL